MKLNAGQHFLLLIIIVVEVILIGAYDESDSPLISRYTQTLRVTQRLDHFNKSDTRFWEQRYFINGEYYTEDGPVFVMVGSDDRFSSIFLRDRYQFTEYAKRYNALCFVVEQRFYGDSRPTGDLSLESLQYFTLDQALEDLVEFRAAMEYRYKLNDRQWIFFGSGNGGLLATNLRIKYPILADGVVASCTQMTFKLDNSEILSTAYKILNKTSPKCMPAIEAAAKQIEAYIEDGPSGWAKLSDIFKVCGVLNGTNQKEIEDFYNLFEKVIFKIVAGSASGYSAVNDESLCQLMNDRMKGPEINRLAQIMRLYLESKNVDCAYKRYEDYVQLMSDTSLYSLYKNSRLNLYRECNERSYFYPSNDPKMPFYSNNSLSVIMEKCADVFGPNYDINFVTSVTYATNKKFGYEAINDQLTNILFVNGADDPEISLQITNDVNSEVKAIVIQGESGCTDTFPNHNYDSKELIKARLDIAREIGNWING